MENSNATTTPMDSSLKLQKDEGEPFNDVKDYRSIVRSLLYLTITHPYIAFSIGIISQFMERPCVGHMATAKRILRHVKGTLDYGFFFIKIKEFILCKVMSMLTGLEMSMIDAPP